MLINKTDVILGMPARTLRDALRRSKYDRFYADPGLLAHALRVSVDEADKLLQHLCSEGYVESRLREYHREPSWHFTTRAMQLLNARVGKLYPRAKADKLVADLKQRIITFNEQQLSRMYLIRYGYLFGSYVTGTEGVGDVDVAIDYHERPQTGEERLRILLAYATEKGYSDPLNGFDIADRERNRLIKAHSPILQFHEISEPAFLNGYPDATIELYRHPNALPFREALLLSQRAYEQDGDDAFRKVHRDGRIHFPRTS